MVYMLFDGALRDRGQRALEQVRSKFFIIFLKHIGMVKFVRRLLIWLQQVVVHWADYLLDGMWGLVNRSETCRRCWG